MRLKGSCLCGAVRYEVDQLDSPIAHCHCVTCRKANAAAFASTARVARDHFHLIAGVDKLAAFESSPGRLRRFCASVLNAKFVRFRGSHFHELRIHKAH